MHHYQGMTLGFTEDANMTSYNNLGSSKGEEIKDEMEFDKYHRKGRKKSVKKFTLKVQSSLWEVGSFSGNGNNWKPKIENRQIRGIKYNDRLVSILKQDS